MSDNSLKPDENELDKLLNMELDELDNRDILNDDFEDPFEVDFDFQDLQNEVRDERELENLTQSEFIVNFEKEVEEFKDDIPQGEAFSLSMGQIRVSERTTQYKENLTDQYFEALNQVEALYKALAAGTQVTPKHIKDIVESYIKVFKTDANILRNFSVFETVESKYLYSHALRVCLLSINIAAAQGYSADQILEVGQAALLADVGMMLVPEAIRFKRGPLNPDEMFEVKKAPIMGLYMLEKVPNLSKNISFVSYQHHEKISGEGYPNRRKGLLIHNYAKIVSIADAFQAMCSARPYRKALNPFHAMDKIISMTQAGHFEPEMVKDFVQTVGLFPIGSLVQLSNKCIAKVVATNGKSIDRPVLSVIMDAEQNQLASEEIYQTSLLKNKDVRIAKPLDYSVDQTMLMRGF